MISVMGEVFFRQCQHVGQDWAKLVYHLKNGNGLLDGTDNFFDPIRDHDKFMDDLPNVTKSLYIEAQTVDSILIQMKAKVVYHEFGNDLNHKKLTLRLQ